MTDVALVTQPYHPTNEDTAKRLVKDSALKFARPWISAGGLKFTWPVGVEGFRVSGTALLGLHRYIGDNTADVHVIHFNEGRIELTGTLPGLTSPKNMVSLQDICMSRNRNKKLSMPGILPKIQYVVVESYDFSHTEDDRTSSIPYTITLVRTGNTGTSSGSGAGRALSDSFQGGSGAPGTPNRGSTSESPRTFTVTQGIDTFPAISDKVYGNVDQWPKLVDLNRAALINNNPNISVRPDQMPYFRWPVGTKIAY